MTADYTFQFLVIGVAKLLKGERYAPELRYALGQLAESGWFRPMTTAQTLREQCQQPLGEWWKGSLPTDFDEDDTILEGSRLSDAASDFIIAISKEKRFQKSLGRIAQWIDNKAFRELLDRLRAIGDDQAQHEYIQLRMFLIENGFTTRSDLRTIFGNLLILNPLDVMPLYTPFDQAGHLVDPHSGFLHNCQRCGPVVVEDEEMRSIKPVVCGADCPRWRDGWQRVKPSADILVLREGNQRRVLIPGKPELALYRAVLRLSERYDEIEPPQLWPDIDMYDLLIQVKQAVWVVDVKDRHSSTTLEDVSHHRTIRWQQAFIVYPSERADETNYAVELQKGVSLKWTQVMSSDEFLHKLEREAQG